MPAEIRGEFRPIATKIPGIDVCEHLPLLAQRSHLWSLVRSLTHSSNDHSAGHQIKLAPVLQAPPGLTIGAGFRTVWFAGGGIRGGRVVGSSDNIGGFPRSDPQTPENMAATIYHALGLPRTIAWHDVERRPHYVYRGEPIPGLT